MMFPTPSLSRGSRTFDVAVGCAPDMLRRWYGLVLREVLQPVEPAMRASLEEAVQTLIAQMECGDADWLTTYRAESSRFSNVFILPNVPRAVVACRALAAVAKAMAYGPGSGVGELIHAWHCHASYERGSATTDESGLRELLKIAGCR